MTLFGSDVSHFDAPDTRAMLGQGISFQTHKAGGDALDAELAGWWARVKGYRPEVLLGAYWVLLPGHPADRADQFLDRLDSTCPGWRDGPFILQADCERWPTTPAPSVSEINTFCDRLAEKMPKLKPIAYAPNWVYGSRISGLRYPIWASSYVTAAGPFRSIYPGDSSSHWGAYGGKSPSILQYSSSATIGGQTTCDANAFRGTFQQLIALLAPGWSTNDVATKDDVIAGLNEWSTPAPRAGAGDTLPENVIGDRALKQPVPNIFQGGKRTPAWVLLTDMATHIANGSSAVDPEAIATAVLAGIADQADGAAAKIAGMVISALPADEAKKVADELATRLTN